MTPSGDSAFPRIDEASASDGFGLTAFSDATARIGNGSSLDHETDVLLGAMSADEILGLLDGDAEFWPGMAEMSRRYNETPVVMGQVARLGLPGIRFSDGPRGVVIGQSTAFPVSMARGATWDVDLEERVGRAIGAEMRAQGGNTFGGVCINLPRHPAWGRAQETYGEDPYLLGEFGAALVRGVRRHGMAVAKHYALNSMENARFKVDVEADDATLHEVYLPHFRRVVEEGVDGIMTSYNSVNGEWVGQNAELLEGILRGRWGFDGVTISDFIFGLRDAGASVRAGLDIEAPFRQQRAQHLQQELADGRVTWGDVRRAARRVIRAQLRYATSPLEPEPDVSVVFCDEHRRLARDVATTSMVLLKNESIAGTALLPLDSSAITSLAVIGRLADIPNTGDNGSSKVHCPEVVTPLEGLRSALAAVDVVHVDGDDQMTAAAVAAQVDVAVVVVGYTAEDEGEFLGDTMLTTPGLMDVFPPLPAGINMPSSEDRNSHLMGTAAGGDRVFLRLRPADAELIHAVAAANRRTVVTVVTAGAVIIEEWKDVVPAILVSWYAGSEGGHALADVLLGKSGASGRLPYSVPADESHLPFFDMEAEAIVYDRWHGQRLLDRDSRQAAYPFGFGLSYTEFTIHALNVHAAKEEQVFTSVNVKNRGRRGGRHVVQLYGRLEVDDFPKRVLIGFAPVYLEPGQEAQVAITGSTRPLQRWVNGSFVFASSTVHLEASSFSGDPAAAVAIWNVR
ncbi:glycoside hydrolase family 3 protein [Amycolatopsis sp. RTGN1]|uniref:glycoside hydrolase family 3 protein n=1 Tax=Amycolatopsis ponsaeliensis TaxID=2992142 RepID=UPI00254C796E|nr:glycoside hydrolase family 3 C-terminal domain-containing protein [Amycolatopsis sp. RTGN1]